LLSLMNSLNAGFRLDDGFQFSLPHLITNVKPSLYANQRASQALNS
jgi:hypothetical protein